MENTKNLKILKIFVIKVKKYFLIYMCRPGKYEKIENFE